MKPAKSLPISDEFSSAKEYIDELLSFVTTSDVFQVLCGGVHILDFFTSEPGLFYTAVPLEWQPFLLQCEEVALLDLLMRHDLNHIASGLGNPPKSLIQYIKDIRRLSMCRSFVPSKPKLPILPRQVALGMNQKKVHEVTYFAGYVDELAADLAQIAGSGFTHLVDFGSGQNYLGRTLASEPYNHQIIAVEARESNIENARRLDTFSGLAEKEKVMRNKKVYNLARDSVDPSQQKDEAALKKAAETLKLTDEEIASIDLRAMRNLQITYRPEKGKGSICYVFSRLEDADLTDVVAQIRDPQSCADNQEQDPRLMAISIHSCGNLSHFGIRSLVLNPSVRAVAIVGCCYNLLTEKLGPPPSRQPALRAVNARVTRESERRDPQGFPMSERLSSHGGIGVRLNVTARMMACQAPQNWTAKDSEGFFTRHFYRAVLQRIFLDKGVITKTAESSSQAELASRQDQPGSANGLGATASSPFNAATNPVIIGSLRKSCYSSLSSYVRGAVAKLTSSPDCAKYCAVVQERMGTFPDDEVAAYEERFAGRRREVSAVWSLMAFSAGVAEALIVADRWLFLREHDDVVRDAWVEPVFDYGQSPRNLVVVGVKR